MRMRRLLIGYLCLSLVFNSGPVFAKEEAEKAIDQAIRAASELRDELNKNYYDHLLITARNAIQTNYLRIFWDHVAARDILASRAQTGLVEIAKLKQQFSESRARIFVGNKNWDQSASQAFATLAAVQNKTIEAGQIVSDAKKLVDNWGRVCEPENLEMWSSYISPLNYMNLIDIDSPSTPEPQIDIGVKVTTNFEGDVQSAETTDSSGAQQDPVDIVGTVGLAAVLYGGPVGIIIGIVLLIVWAVLKIGSFTHQIYKMAGKEAKLIEIKKQIRNIQLSALSKVGVQTPAMMAEICAETFPKEMAEKLNLDILNAYHRQSAEALSELKDQSDEIIVAYRDRYKNLNQIYFPALKTSYASLVDVRLSQIQKTNEQIQKMLETVFSPLFGRYQVAQGRGGLVLWSSQYDIWGANLLADGYFRAEPGFSLFSIADDKSDSVSKFSNRWFNIGAKMVGVLQ